MKIDFIPTEHTLAKIARIKDLRAQGKTFDQIAEEIGNHRTYIIALHSKFVKGAQHE